MGGGGGYSSFSDEDLRALENDAKKALDAANLSVKNVFISFDSEDLAQVNLLRAQAKNENTDLEFRDYSVKEPFDSKDKEYIQRKIREKIKQTSATIVYLSEKTGQSRWVNWEIQESIKLGKKVIAIYSGDKVPRDIPKVLADISVIPIKWNHDAIDRELNK